MIESYVEVEHFADFVSLRSLDLSQTSPTLHNLPLLTQIQSLTLRSVTSGEFIWSHAFIYAAKMPHLTSLAISQSYSRSEALQAVKDLRVLTNLTALDIYGFTTSDSQDLAFLTELHQLKFLRLTPKSLSDVPPLPGVNVVLGSTQTQNP